MRLFIMTINGNFDTGRDGERRDRRGGERFFAPIFERYREQKKAVSKVNFRALSQGCLKSFQYADNADFYYVNNQ
jgi:hypothetical protein